MAASSSSGRGGLHFSASSMKIWCAFSVFPYRFSTRPAKWDMVELRCPWGMPLSWGFTMQSMVISPSCQRISSEGQPKMNRAQSRAFPSKKGNCFWIARFNAVHEAPSVIGSWGKYTWNRGLADFPSFGFMLLRLGTATNATSRPSLSSSSPG